MSFQDSDNSATKWGRVWLIGVFPTLLLVAVLAVLRGEPPPVWLAGSGTEIGKVTGKRDGVKLRHLFLPVSFPGHRPAQRSPPPATAPSPPVSLRRLLHRRGAPARKSRFRPSATLDPLSSQPLRCPSFWDHCADPTE